MDRIRELPAFQIDPRTHLGRVHYTVASLEKMVAFYRDLLGFRLLWQEGDSAGLGAGERELLRLTQVDGAKRVRRTTGLYHTAFLLPTRWDLAHLVKRVLVSGAPIHGHSNHGTHLAFYLPDPEGNGIELAWDFPRDQWPMTPDGMYDIARAPRSGIDLEELLAELERDASPWEGLAPATVVGHVHLHVSSLNASRAFYHGVLGLDVTLDRDDFGALFVSAGGYHHHVGANIWLGEGAPPAPPYATGLRSFTIVVPGRQELDRLIGRLEEAQLPYEPQDEGVLVKDPSQIGVLLVAD